MTFDDPNHRSDLSAVIILEYFFKANVQLNETRRRSTSRHRTMNDDAILITSGRGECVCVCVHAKQAVSIVTAVYKDRRVDRRSDDRQTAATLSGDVMMLLFSYKLVCKNTLNAHKKLTPHLF